MKESFANDVLKGVQARVDMAAKSIAKQYKGVRPFNKVPMTREDKIRQFDEATPQELANLRGEIGDDAMMDWAEEIARLRGGV